MTKQEAIELLHPDTSAEAMTKYEYWGGFTGKEAKLNAVIEACIIACDALQESIDREEDKDENYSDWGRSRMLH